MASLAFDTHKFVTRLTGAGMAPEQAEVLAETYAGLLTDRLATKDEMRALDKGVTDLREEMHSEIGKLREEMHREIGLLREEMHREIGLLREETKKEFATLRTEIGKDLAALRSEINARIAYSQLATIVILSAVMGAFRIFG